MDARRLDRWLPLVVFVLALLVRLPGIGWGLRTQHRNASLHPDETPNFGYSRAVVPALGWFTPGFYSYGTLYLTSLSVATDVASAYTGGPKTREGWSWTDPSKTDWDWVSRCILAGRVLSTLAGAATAMVVFLLGRRIAGALAGIAAAALIAISPALVVHSRFSTPDVQAVSLISLALWMAVEASRPDAQGKRVSYADWCGIATGLAASVKYTGALVLLALYAALALGKHPRALRKAAGATLLAVFVFVLTTPGVVLDSAAFLRDFVFEMRHTATGQELFFAGTANGFIFQAGNLFLGIGPFLVVGGVSGLAWACYRRRTWAFVLLAFAFPYSVLIGRAEVKFARYSFPLYPPLAVGFGYAIATARRRRGWGGVAVAGGLLGIGGIPAGGVRETVDLTLAMLRPDPRDVAGDFLRHDPLPVGLARDPWYWTPSLVPDGAAPRSAWPAIRAEIQASSLPAVLYPLTAEGGQTYFDPRTFDLRPPRIATTGFETDYPVRLRGRKDLAPGEESRVEAANAWLDRLHSEYEIERVEGTQGYGVEDLDYVRPQVRIWKRKTP